MEGRASRSDRIVKMRDGLVQDDGRARVSELPAPVPEHVFLPEQVLVGATR